MSLGDMSSCLSSSVTELHDGDLKLEASARTDGLSAGIDHSVEYSAALLDSACRVTDEVAPSSARRKVPARLSLPPKAT